ncbi:MAG: hypothetical protein V1813_00405 [Candidatus Aenigmatarchaeota archaeon]
MAREPEEYVDIDSFMDEMVAIIEKRLRAQEEAIAKVEMNVAEIKKSLSGKSKVKIDKSLLKILRQ